MQIPLEIAFHHVDAPEGAENAIRDHVTRLERIFGRLTGCVA